MRAVRRGRFSIMDSKEERFIRDVRDLASAHRETAEALEQTASDLEKGNYTIHDFINILKERNQRGYLEIVP